jgi:hypothetical protein
MKLTQLLNQREILLHQSHLANLAYAHAQLAEFAARIARAGLRGRVTLRHPSPQQEIFSAALTAVEGNQSVIEEHFTDLEVADLADVIGYLCGQSFVELTFPIQDLSAKFLVPLQRELQRLGVEVEEESRATALPSDETSPQQDRQQSGEQS